MRARIAVLISVGVSAVFGLCYWRNKRQYKNKTCKWLGGKSLIETCLICCSMYWQPQILVAWCTIWAVRPIKTPAVKAAVAIIAGLLFEAMITPFLAFGVLISLGELLIICSIWSIDLVTGTNGFIKRHKEVEKRYHDAECQAA